ncbi:MAG: hypothetical protein A2946_02305 [Candidatus Liptonbacteria bacterium RIFCSPLOWO2_01_FULL_53_13]|uniref:GIY-YIG domain-containing protein n=1 Tax=Candidatus Liptonbacteria bacterium RIFCSPLOWO2_01_FULL_53_13 TaxID=1798651 RepID=A0A1G2CGN5_9BACT|nr:MAG: hypothetical protein A2946_02305 [Candidatus Liptonbacteria bacterium RIFCSPLOWO2_01_FULL_53_13]
MDKYKLSQSTIEKLGYYVYLLVDPKTEEVFYVGKGKGNRVNQHSLVALHPSAPKTLKISKIQSILKSDGKYDPIILRHDLTNDEAFQVESAIIDFITKGKLTNLVLGHDSEDKGRMSLAEIKIKYEAKDAVFREPVLLININNNFNRTMTRKQIYEATRKHWKVSLARVNKIRFACAVYRGIVREIFLIKKWVPSRARGRHMFQGSVAPALIRDRYLYTSVAKYWKQGSQYPIKYVDIK